VVPVSSWKTYGNQSLKCIYPDKLAQYNGHKGSIFRETRKRDRYSRGRRVNPDSRLRGNDGFLSPIHTKPATRAGSVRIGWGTRIRTLVGGVRVRSPAARRSPNKVSSARHRGKPRMPVQRDQRLENWVARRALRRPTFLRSTSRASRVTRPARRRVGRSSSL
jgi:hypothetical protein